MIAYKYKLYSNARNGHLDSQIDQFGRLYNHCIALHRRYYRIFKQSVNVYALTNHIAKLKKIERFHWIAELPSQAVQDVARRIDKAYLLFFRNLKHSVKTAPPSFKPRRKYKSFTLTQAGYAFNGNQIRIGKKRYGFHKSREMQGRIKTVTIKRDECGDFWIIAVTDWEKPGRGFTTGKSAGFDFGMKVFLTSSDGDDVEAPLFLKRDHNKRKALCRSLSSKQRGSNSRRKAKLALARFYRTIESRRNDFQWKIADRLVNKYDVLCFEDLNLKGMSHLFGKKCGEYGFAEFLHKVESKCSEYGKGFVKIGRFYPSSKTCHKCGWIKSDLKLSERTWQCNGCGEIHDRDRNAAMNILRVGASTRGGEDVRLAQASGL